MNRLIPMKRALLTFVLLALLALLLAPAIALAAPAVHVVTGIALTPKTPNVMRLDQKVELSFTYVSPEPTGVRIFARPMTGGVLTPYYAAHGSPLYPSGSGTGTGWFTITRGNISVDHVRIQMWNAAQTVKLDEVVIPVRYRFTSASKNVVSRLSMTATPNVLKQKQKVSVQFKYRTTKTAGVRIFVRPLTGGSLTRGYSAHASALYKGAGSGTGWFTVTRGAPTVDKVRVQMWNASQTRLLFKAVLPVHYKYAKPANIVSSIKLTPANPNVFRLGQRLGLTFKYTTNEPSGVYIFARPLSGGLGTPNYAAHPSGLYPVGGGAAIGWFTINDVAATVDEIQIRMIGADQSNLLFETRLPVSGQFK